MGGNSAHVIPLAWWAARGPDDQGLVMGLDSDIRILHRSTALAADTEVTGVIEGTSEHPGVAADSLIISNVANDGDILLLVSKAGNSQGVLWADGSSGDTAVMAASGASVDHYIAGTKVLDHAAGAFAFQENTTISSTGTLTMGAVTLGGAVAGGDQAFTNVGDMTFAAGSIIASGATNGNTLILRANDTDFITFTTGATDACTLAGVTLSGTILASGTVTIPAITLGGAVAGGAQNWTNVGNITLAANKFIGCTASNAQIDFVAESSTTYSSYLRIYGTDHASFAGRVEIGTSNGASSTTARMTFTGVLATDVLTWNAVYHVGLKYGLAGTATGAFTMDGATSGVVTVTVAAAAGTWTMTLPAAVGTAGYFLVDAAGDGITSWSNTLPAVTLGGNITGNSKTITALASLTVNGGGSLYTAVDNSYVQFAGGNSRPAFFYLYGSTHATKKSYVELYTPNLALGADILRLQITGTVDTAVAAWASVYHTGLKYGLAGTATGAFTMDGATSGVVTVTVAAAAGTWTMTLPAAAGTSGQQLSTNGSGVCSWTDAASLRSLKNIVGEHSPQDALDKILHTRVYDFHYKEGKGTGDQDTLYTGIMAEDAPWAMHYNGGVVNPVNTLGFMVLGFQAHEERIQELERELAELKGRA